MNQIDTMSVNAIRVLAADAVQKAKSGHPGLPLGSAAMAYELWANHMNHNPKNPQWKNRDRFILSGGHGSTLLYSLLHLFGYGLTKEDMMNFRQMDSLTPGHPEYGHTVGVEATTGPLGAGMGMAVGMAMAESHLAAVFNKDGYPVVDHYTYVLGGDGCMMEGISSEAFSLAGTLGLSKLIVFYDSNKISIEGSTDIAFTENVQKRMEAFGFQLLTVEDGNDLDAIGRAIEEAKADTARPSFITVKTQIGYGCPAKQGKASAHGEPLGDDNVTAMKENLNWPSMEPFYVPDEVYANYEAHAEKGAKAEEKWNALFDEYCQKYPEMKDMWDKFHNPELAKAAYDCEEYWAYDEKPDATRSLSGKQLQKLKNLMPNLIGGILLGYIWQILLNGVLANLQKPLLALDAKAGFIGLVILMCWQQIGYMMIIYVAGLQSVPGDLIEAAKIDGANDREILFKIKIPMVMPSVTICTFLTLTNSFKLFDQNVALTAGEPANASEMLALNIYNTFYGRSGAQWKGIGQAKAVVFFLIVVVISLIQLHFTRSKEVQQ